MMRSPRSFVVVCRRPDHKIVIKEAPWISVWDRLRFLRWPVLRGGVVFWETLQNGLQALSFSAEQQVVEVEGDASAPVTMDKGAITGTIVFSLVLAFLLFAALPHLLAFVTGQLLGVPLDGKSLTFHAIDAVFKLGILVGYMWGISRLKEIQRVFMYHGAEHKAIFTYEAGEELTLDNARKYTTFHPRCGTSFLILVILVSVLVFTGVFAGPWMPTFSANRWLNQMLYVAIKLPLMFPIAGLAYEFLKYSGRHPEHPVLRPLIAPGLWLQRITTREPTDDQLEIALLSLRKVLWREAQPPEAPGARSATGWARPPEVYDSPADLAELPLLPPPRTTAAAAPAAQAP